MLLPLLITIWLAFCAVLTRSLLIPEALKLRVQFAAEGMDFAADCVVGVVLAIAFLAALLGVLTITRGALNYVHTGHLAGRQADQSGQEG